MSLPKVRLLMDAQECLVGGKAFAPLLSSSLNDIFAAFGLHPFSKSMLFYTPGIMGLKSSLWHDSPLN
jgi:hypothetical protein